MGSRQGNGETWSRSKTPKDPVCCTERSRLSPRAPGGDWRASKLVGKNVPANAGDSRDSGLIPGSGKSPGGGHGNPLQSSCLENPMDRGAWRVQFMGLQRVGPDWAPEHKGVISSGSGISCWLPCRDRKRKRQSTKVAGGHQTPCWAYTIFARHFFCC